MNAAEIKNYRASVAFLLSEERDLSLEAIGQVLREPSKDKVRSLVACGRKNLINVQPPQDQKDAA